MICVPMSWAMRSELRCAENHMPLIEVSVPQRCCETAWVSLGWARRLFNPIRGPRQVHHVREVPVQLRLYPLPEKKVSRPCQ